MAFRIKLGFIPVALTSLMQCSVVFDKNAFETNSKFISLEKFC